ncbi:hypothetical protein CEXT_639121 [Caerostris extrusa]|uniref:Uncharacterized protein n=1 Tax=Caerostris extrusa TaxID=172846 RepID=A0AAV4WLR3_CAEEX|nr:hypothetical protein CEXT_639121 [Caerostris extrusa]
MKNFAPPPLHPHPNHTRANLETDDERNRLHDKSFLLLLPPSSSVPGFHLPGVAPTPNTPTLMKIEFSLGKIINFSLSESFRLAKGVDLLIFIK